MINVGGKCESAGQPRRLRLKGERGGGRTDVIPEADRSVVDHPREAAVSQ